MPPPMVKYAVNAATGKATDVEVGSAAERTMYRVMAMGYTEKLFFDSREQYLEWGKARAKEAAGLGRA